MRTSKYLLSTLKEIPNNTELISHQLMLRAGMIRKLSYSLYVWLPTGLRVLRKLENIVREEMEKIESIELSMPVVQPADLWKKSGRFFQYGQELISFNDRKNRSFVLAPTHEEVITEIIRNEIKSYKNLPLIFFQIQTKFRDEIRPRFGVIRSREFIMKDAYSFHTNNKSLKKTYDNMYRAYANILNRICVNFRVVKANTGNIGGNISHEFQILASNGENNIVISTDSNYAANINFAEAIPSKNVRSIPLEKLKLVNTPYPYNLLEVIKNKKKKLKNTVKTIIVHANKNQEFPFIGLILRSDHDLNKFKAEKLPQVFTPLKFANKKEIYLYIGSGPESLGPINLPFPLIIDRSVAVMSNFSAGSNIYGKHFIGINWNRDLLLPEIADLRNVVEGDISPDGKGNLKFNRGIEVAHIFQLGTKYSKKMKATVQGEDGNNKLLIMGCYGLGITRLVAAYIEQNYDKRGILWPISIAPFHVGIVPINIKNSYKVKNYSEYIYKILTKKGFEVLFYDTNERPGVMFSNMDLIGIPHVIIIGERNLKKNIIEYKNRNLIETQFIKINLIVDFLSSKINL